MEQPQAQCYNYECDKSSSTSLSACSACKTALYCSKECQKQDWKNHKPFCRHVTSNGTSSASMHGLEYYKKIAAYDPKAQALAHEIGLTLPDPTTHMAVLILAPMRRLVLTGKDLPENISLFFGQNKTNDMEDLHKSKRMEVLLDAPVGSPMHAQIQCGELDENCPYRSPRKASEKELENIRMVRRMQEDIRQYMGPRGVGVDDITDDDMVDILLKFFGGQWSEGLQTFQHAINTMDRKVDHRKLLPGKPSSNSDAD